MEKKENVAIPFPLWPRVGDSGPHVALALRLCLRTLYVITRPKGLRRRDYRYGP